MVAPKPLTFRDVDFRLYHAARYPGFSDDLRGALYFAENLLAVLRRHSDIDLNDMPLHELARELGHALDARNEQIDEHYALNQTGVTRTASGTYIREEI